MGAVSKIKVKVIQGIIQLEYLINWSINNIMKTGNEMKLVEIYNNKKKRKLENIKLGDYTKYPYYSQYTRDIFIACTITTLLLNDKYK
jgi:hypothetical protein